jgi:hypothetical protein
MEIENEKTRKPRRRFSAEEKARIVGLFQHFLVEVPWPRRGDTS